jgi:hypothetical protein
LKVARPPAEVAVAAAVAAVVVAEVVVSVVAAVAEEPGGPAAAAAVVAREPGDSVASASESGLDSATVNSTITGVRAWLVITRALSGCIATMSYPGSVGTYLGGGQQKFNVSANAMISSDKKTNKQNQQQKKQAASGVE